MPRRLRARIPGLHGDRVEQVPSGSRNNPPGVHWGRSPFRDLPHAPAPGSRGGLDAGSRGWDEPRVPSDPSATVLSDDEAHGIPRLADPPIEEVVCGVVFAPVAALDALEQGVYWDSVSNRFPNKQVQPVLLDGAHGMFVQGVAPIRSWLISKDGDFLIQIQQDRFYMNWRRRAGAYPRFRDHVGDRGLCSRALEEFERFQTFLKSRFGVSTEPHRIELQKQDLLLRGKHWSNLRDLSTIMPVVSTLADVQTSEHAGFNLRMAEPDAVGQTTLQIATKMDADHKPDAVRLDFHRSAPLAGGDIKDSFHSANTRLNLVFSRLFTPAAWPRFGGSNVNATG